MYDEEPEESEKRAIRQKSFAFQLIGRTIYQHSITLACTSRSSDDNVISSILYFDDGTESNEEENWCKEAVYLFKQYIYIYIYTVVHCPCVLPTMQPQSAHVRFPATRNAHGMARRDRID